MNPFSFVGMVFVLDFLPFICFNQSMFRLEDLVFLLSLMVASGVVTMFALLFGLEFANILLK